MDTAIPEIRFDADGVCQYCYIHDVLDKRYPLNDQGRKELETVIKTIKAKGKSNQYDCVVGVSGGRDSMWTLYTAAKLGLRPLAVHFDNGWNSEIAAKNISRGTEILGVDLETVVADWHEFRDLQIAFLKASTPDVEVPTDLAIHSVLHRVAAKEGIKYILNGHSFRTEGMAPIGWTYFDGRYISSVYRRFGTMKLRDFTNFGVWELFRYSILGGITVVPLLNSAPYNEGEVTRILETEMGWRYYGGHHQESNYTKFIQTYLLPTKFDIDKRKTEYSALIRSGQMQREEASNKMHGAPYECEDELIKYSVSKLGLSEQDWQELYSRPPKSFLDYPSLYPVMRMFRPVIKWMTDIGLLPELLYLKYLY